MWGSWYPSNWFGLGKSSDAKYAYQVASVWYALNRISVNVGAMDCMLYELNNNKIEARPLARSSWLLNKNPSELYGALTFKQTMTWHALWYGNGRAYIHNQGPNSELIILDPDRTVTGIAYGQKYHATYLAPNENVVWNSSQGPENRLQLLREMEDNPDYVVVLPDADVFHICGFGNGIRGIPLFEVARTSFESMMTADARAENQLTNGFLAKIAIEAPNGALRDAEEARELRDSVEEDHAFQGGKKTVMLLRDGLTAKTLNAMDNNAAQFVEMREYMRQDTALWFLLESMIGDKSASSYNSLEQRQLSYLLNCLDGWLHRWEEEADRKLLSQRQFRSGNWRHEFDVQKMLRTDMATQANTFSTLITSRVINPNEARARLNLNPYEGGELFINPAVSPMESVVETAEEVTDNGEQDAIRNHVEVLLKAERRQVRDRRAKGKTLQQIEVWYDKSFCPSLAAMVERNGGSPYMAQQYCAESLERLVQLNGEPFDRVNEAEQLAQQIIKDKSCLTTT